MTLVDSSVWVDFLRGVPTPAAAFVRERLGGDELETSEPVLMELLAGSRPGDSARRIERLLSTQAWCSVDSRLDFRRAATVYQATRATGHRPRGFQDCLIAAIALRHGVHVAHRDGDFEYIAAATGLEVIDLRG